jgi:predicted hydrocarbon binding protein
LSIKIHNKIEINPKRGEIVRVGFRDFIVNPIQISKKIDSIFLTAAESIVQYQWFAHGFEIFDAMLRQSSEKLQKEEVLKELIDLQRFSGWGKISYVIEDENTPRIRVTIKNPPVKTNEGSAKRIVSGFLAGVHSRFFDKHISVKKVVYDERKDEMKIVLEG